MLHVPTVSCCHNMTGDCLRTSLFPMISALFHGFVKTQFLTATTLGVCLLLLIYIQVSYPHSSILSLHIIVFYTDFFLFLDRSFKFPPYQRVCVQQYFFFSCHCKFSRFFCLINSLHFIKYNCSCILSPILTVAENTFNFSMFYCWNTVFPFLPMLILIYALPFLYSPPLASFLQ